MVISILPECAVAILLRKVSVAAVSSFAFNAAKLSTNLSFYPPFFPQQNEIIPDTKYVCMQVFLFFLSLNKSTDYGCPMKPFFLIEIQNLWTQADKFWGIWGIFGQISVHILVQ